MNDLSKLPYAKWLEESLHNIVGMPVESICILTKYADGNMGTQYYNCSVADKILYAGYLQQDAMLDTMRINGYLVDDEEEETI